VCKDYTPELAEDITGVPADKIKEVARMFKENDPCDHLSMGNQHSVGSQNIRSYALLQLILGMLENPAAAVLRFASR